MQRASGLSQWQSGRPYNPAWGITRSIRDGYERSVWIYRCVHAIAGAQAKLRIVARYGDPGNYSEGKEIPDHPIATLLNSRPSPNEFSYAFRYRMHATQLLSPTGAFVETVPNSFGDPAQLTLLPPHLTAPIPNARTFVSGYNVRMGPGYTDLQTVQPERVLWLRRPHLLDPYRSMTPLEAAGLAVETDYLAKLYQRNFMANDGTPTTLIRVKGSMTPGDAEDVKRQITGGGGPRNAGRVSVVSADDIDAKVLSQGMKDMDYVNGRKALKEELLGAFGVDESIALGNTSGRTFDNADAAKYNFWTECMDDELALMSQAWSTLDPDPDVVIGFDTSTVEVLQRDKREKAVFFLAEVGSQVRTINEYRPLSPSPMDPYEPPDVDPQPDPITGEPGTPPPNPADVLRPGAPPPTATVVTLDSTTGANTVPTGSGVPKARLAAAKTGETAAEGETERFLPNPAIVDQHRELITDVMVRLYDRQAKVVAAKLAGPKARRGTFLNRPEGGKAVDVTSIYDLAVWDAQLAADGRPALLAAVDAVGSDIAKQANFAWSDPDGGRRRPAHRADGRHERHHPEGDRGCCRRAARRHPRNGPRPRRGSVRRCEGLPVGDDRADRTHRSRVPRGPHRSRARRRRLFDGLGKPAATRGCRMRRRTVSG